MRVITGSARGVKLKSPAGMQTRPTADRVKEALFSKIQFELPGARVLDLFAGTGQLGIEALSRGAAERKIPHALWCGKICGWQNLRPKDGLSARIIFNT